MISMSSLLIVIFVCTLVGTNLLVMHLWLGEKKAPRPVKSPAFGRFLPSAAPA